jgi:adenine phosphoribosyltransferase
MQIEKLVRTIPHHPKAGVMFRDITTLLKDPTGFRVTIDALAERYRDRRIGRAG